jgi:hypothetical protein
VVAAVNRMSPEQKAWEAEFSRMGEENVRLAMKWRKGKPWLGQDNRVINEKYNAAGRWLDKQSGRKENRNFWLAITGILIGLISLGVAIAAYLNDVGKISPGL